jgi:hypothetical protein
MIATLLKKLVDGVQKIVPGVKRGKEKLIEEALKKAVLYHLRGAINLTRFRVDTEGKTLFLEITPAGETVSLTVEVIGYSIEKLDSSYSLLFDDVTTSKQWVNSIIKEFLPKFTKDGAVQIPDKFQNIVKAASLLL